MGKKLTNNARKLVGYNAEKSLGPLRAFRLRSRKPVVQEVLEVQSEGVKQRENASKTGLRSNKHKPGEDTADEDDGESKAKGGGCCDSKICWWEPPLECLPLDFCSNTSLHGLKYLGQSKRHLSERYVRVWAPYYIYCHIRFISYRNLR